MVKISDQINVKIFDPIYLFHRLSASPFSEVYKFYTNDEAREIIAKLIKATKPDDEEGPRKK